MINKILTKIFGWKYYIIVYETKTSGYIARGNLDIKVRLLNRIDIDFVKKELSNRYNCSKNEIMLLNAIKVAKIKGFKSAGDDDE